MNTPESAPGDHESRPSSIGGDMPPAADAPRDPPTAPTDDTLTDPVRRRLLRIALYVPPAIIGTFFVARSASAAPSCGPAICSPTVTCLPDLCAPSGLCMPNTCGPDLCQPNLCLPDVGIACGPDVCMPSL